MKKILISCFNALVWELAVLVNWITLWNINSTLSFQLYLRNHLCHSPEVSPMLSIQSEAIIIYSIQPVIFHTAQPADITNAVVQSQCKCDTEGQRFFTNPAKNSISMYHLNVTLQPEFDMVIAQQDPGLTIVQLVLNVVKEPVNAIATNTEIICLLLYHIQENYENVYFQAQT